MAFSGKTAAQALLAYDADTYCMQPNVYTIAAIVSAVLPNGEVLYTQHTPGAVDDSLPDRAAMGLQEEGGQTPTIVRPPGPR